MREVDISVPFRNDTRTWWFVPAVGLLVNSVTKNKNH